MVDVRLITLVIYAHAQQDEGCFNKFILNLIFNASNSFENRLLPPFRPSDSKPVKFKIYILPTRDKDGKFLKAFLTSCLIESNDVMFVVMQIMIPFNWISDLIVT